MRSVWAVVLLSLPAAAQVRVVPVLPGGASVAVPGAAAPALPAQPGAQPLNILAPTGLGGLSPLSPLPETVLPETAPAPEAAPQAPAEGGVGVSKPLPEVDFSAFKPEAFKNISAGQAKEEGDASFEALLGRQARRSKGVSAQDASSLKQPNGPEKDVYSNHRLQTFEFDPESFALEYLLDAPRSGPKAMDFAVGIVVHQTMERVFRGLQSGVPGEDFTLKTVLGYFDEAWKRIIKKGDFVPKDGFEADDYRRRAESYLRRKHAQLYPFADLGRVHSVETELRWTLTDPATGKAYKFKGTPDRVMVQGDTVYIHDWKTHMNPPSLEQLRRDDYQLALYAIALKQLQPEQMKDKRFVLVWDYKEFSHHIEADAAYLAETEQRVFRVLHGIESFAQRLELERADWERRAKPVARPAGLKEVLASVDELGRLDSKAKAKRLELRELDAAIAEKEKGLAAYADKKGLETVSGKNYKAAFKAKTEAKLPTQSSDPAAQAEVMRILKEAGLWEKYSTLDYTAVKDAAEIQGHPDHALFGRLRARLKMFHANELKVEENAERLWSQPGVTPYRLHPAESLDVEPEPGLYSVSRVALFERSPKDYVLRYLFNVRELGPRDYVLAVGLACHQTFEAVFRNLKAGKEGRDMSLKDIVSLYRSIWAEVVAEAQYKPAKGWTASDYKRKGEEYVKAKYEQLHPFDRQGEILYLERRLPFTVTDPETGKVYRFQGIPDRVMVEGDTVVIRDWKTHFVPKSEDELRAEDFQLAMYALALRQQFPQLMAGKKIKLTWDFKDQTVVIDADEAYLKATQERVVRLLREIEAFTAQVDKDREKWEELAGKRSLPKSDAAARAWVDELGRLRASRAAKQAELDRMAERREPLVEAVQAFALEKGWWELEGAKYTASLRKKPVTEVPTKTADAKAHGDIVSVLKSAGMWDGYSRLDLPALKKALSDPKHPDQAVFKKLLPLLKETREVKLQLEPLKVGSAPAAADGSPES